MVELSAFMEEPNSLISFLRFSKTTLIISKSKTLSIICFLSAGDILRNDLNDFIEIEIMFEYVAYGISIISESINDYASFVP